jgi:hypothetical protein
MPRELDKTHYNLSNPYDRIEIISAHKKSSNISSNIGGNGSNILSKNISMTLYDYRRLSNHTNSKIHS